MFDGSSVQFLAAKHSPDRAPEPTCRSWEKYLRLFDGISRSGFVGGNLFAVSVAVPFGRTCHIGFPLADKIAIELHLNRISRWQTGTQFDHMEPQARAQAIHGMGGRTPSAFGFNLIIVWGILFWSTQNRIIGAGGEKGDIAGHCVTSRKLYGLKRDQPDFSSAIFFIAAGAARELVAHARSFAGWKSAGGSARAQESGFASSGTSPGSGRHHIVYCSQQARMFCLDSRGGRLACQYQDEGTTERGRHNF